MQLDAQNEKKDEEKDRKEQGEESESAKREKNLQYNWM